jgi:hypothetical protein
MPLDVLGRPRATLMYSTSLLPWPTGLGNFGKFHHDGDISLQLLVFNEECLVSVSHQLALTTSLPFVHTARHSCRLNGPVKCSDRGDGGSLPRSMREKSIEPYHLEGEVITTFP